MKPKGINGSEDGLLEYIEDIVETSNYKDKVEKSRESVDEIDVQRDNMIIKVKLAESEYDELEKKSKKAFEYIRLCNELTTRKVQLYNIAILDCDDKIRECKERIVSICIYISK